MIRNSFLAGLIVLSALLSACKMDAEIETSYGRLVGVRTSDVTYFLGVPYAKAPTRDLRWADPQPPAPWGDVRDATHYGHACVQYGFFLPARHPDEDCLNLNIWVPNTPGPHPVMFWVHGGGMISGSNNEPQYDGAALARDQNVIVVSVNYRLGVAGFFALPATGNRPAITGNQSVKDLLQALRWVRNDISRFNGDPNNITVFGESAGGLHTCFLLATPHSYTPERLFQRAIMESGVCETMNTLSVVSSLDVAQREGSAFIQALGCHEQDEPLDCARKVSPRELRRKTLMNATVAITLRPEEFRFPMHSVIDGDIFPAHPLTLLTQSAPPDRPILLGTNKDEGSLMVGTLDHPADAARFPAFLEERYPGDGQLFAGWYPPERYHTTGDAHAALRADLAMHCPTLNMARIYSEKNTVWMYSFSPSVISPIMQFPRLLFGSEPPALGTFHGAEIGFVFDFPLLTSTLRPSDRRVQRFMQSAWGQFAHTGNPNGPLASGWEPFDASQNNFLKIQDPPVMTDDFRDGACDPLFQLRYQKAPWLPQE